MVVPKTPTTMAAVLESRVIFGQKVCVATCPQGT